GVAGNFSRRRRLSAANRKLGTRSDATPKPHREIGHWRVSRHMDEQVANCQGSPARRKRKATGGDDFACAARSLRANKTLSSPVEIGVPLASAGFLSLPVASAT